MIYRLLNSLILLPDAYHYQAPADLGLQAEAVTFPNRQGLPLHGLFCWQDAQATDDRLRPEALPVVLFCPGTSGKALCCRRALCSRVDRQHRLQYCDSSRPC